MIAVGEVEMVAFAAGGDGFSLWKVGTSPADHGAGKWFGSEPLTWGELVRRNGPRPV